MLLEAFANANGTVKERDMSVLLAKLFKTKQDLLLTPLGHGPLLDRVDKITLALSAAKQAARPVALYMRSQKVTHLEKVLRPLEVIFTYLQERGITGSPELLAIRVKATFHRKHSDLGIDAALEYLSGNLPPAKDAIPSWCKPHEIATDCCMAWLYEFLASPLATNADTERGGVDEDWPKTKATFAAATKAMVKFCEKRGGDDFADFQKLMLAMDTIATAATVPDGTKPSDLRAAFDLIGSATNAGTLREGLKACGMGQALELDARVLLATGELDDEYTEIFLSAAARIFDLGFGEVGSDCGDIFLDGRWHNDCGANVIEALRECMPDLAILGKLSHAKLSEEIDTVEELLIQVGFVVGIFDRLCWHKCVGQLLPRRTAWADELKLWKCGEPWPPGGVAKAALNMEMADEMPMQKFSVQFKTFLDANLEKLRKHSDDVLKLSESVTKEFAAWQQRRDMRAVIYIESKLIDQLTNCEAACCKIAFEAYIANGEGGGVIGAAMGIMALHDQAAETVYVNSEHVSGVAIHLVNGAHADGDEEKWTTW